jgi:hypothetical protein
MTSANVPHHRLRTRWLGWIVFAGIVMLAIGIVQILYGLAALSRSGMTVISQTGTAVMLNFSHVGLTYLIVGAVLVVAGISVMFGRTWARVVGIALAVLSLLSNLAFFTVYPIWSTLVIILDVVVIYALAAHGREAKPAHR